MYITVRLLLIAATNINDLREKHQNHYKFTIQKNENNNC